MTTLFPWLILFLPLAACLTIVVFTHANRELSARLSIGAIVVPFWLTVILFFDPDLADRAVDLSVNWLAVGSLTVDFGLHLDRLALLMLLVVTGVGGAIHIYSYDYMRGEKGFARYFACLSLFTFSMLGIVLTNNFFLMFVFWELVGVSSYLLIGFWYERPAAADAAKKAFLTTRLGDAGFLAGIILLWTQVGTLDFGPIQQRLAADPRILTSLASLIGILVFCGAMGKSAQFPLHVWLPDAMEGPTPVSALIHAATMVAAGVYLLCRVFFIFQATPMWPGSLQWLDGITPLNIIAWLGLITALMSALIAVQQNDFKRILAYSTLSQLGYMVMAVGLTGPGPAMYHLTTHACFKALLFLGAGSVILALHHEQDIWKMGGLSAKMPVTFWTFLVATLALCGLPPFSGFFSKDEILALAYQQNKLIFVLATGAAALTAFYMFRLMFVAFAGPARSPNAEHAHDSGQVMLLPMLVLAVPAALAGFWGIDQYLAKAFAEQRPVEALAWYDAVFAPFSRSPLPAFAGLGAIAFGFIVARELYREARTDPLPGIIGGLAQALRHRLYWDEIYAGIIAITQDALAKLVAGFDRWIIAGAGVRGIHGTIELCGRLLRLAQTGNLQTYAFWFGGGVLVVLLYVLAR